MLLDIVKAFLVGVCASAPLGPIAILVIQKSIGKGHRAGFITGLGASVVDTLYASIAIFALAFAQKFIDDHQNIILLVGGVVLAVLGTVMMFSNPLRKLGTKGEQTVSVKDFAQALLMGFSNPASIFVIFTLFAFFGLADDSPQTWRVAPIILSLSAGSVTYWFTFSGILSHLRKGFSLRTILWISRITGAIVIIIGIALLVDGLFRVIFYGMPII